MITSYKDYQKYLNADKEALNLKVTFYTWIFSDIWKFYKLLRKFEYVTNCNKNILYYLWIKYCRLNVCVNIGSVYNKKGLPIIGDNVYIGPGVKIYGPIIIGDNVSIGANAVVNKSFPEGNCKLAGIPAKKVSNNWNKFKNNMCGDNNE